MNAAPGLSQRSCEMIRQQDILRPQHPTNPEKALKDEQIKRENDRTNREEGRNKMASCSIKRRPQRLWRALRRLSGKRVFTAPNQPVSFSNKIVSPIKENCYPFCLTIHQTNSHRPNTSTRRIFRLIRKKHKLNPNAAPFTTDQISAAMKASENSTTLSTDGLTILQLKSLLLWLARLQQRQEDGMFQDCREASMCL